MLSSLKHPTKLKIVLPVACMDWAEADIQILREVSQNSHEWPITVHVFQLNVNLYIIQIPFTILHYHASIHW